MDIIGKGVTRKDLIGKGDWAGDLHRRPRRSKNSPC